MQNNPEEICNDWLTITEAMQALNLEKSDFIAFVENNHFSKYAPVSGGVKANKTKILYKTAEIIESYKTYNKDNNIFITRLQAQEYVHIKRTRFFAFVKKHNIKPFTPLDPGGERRSGTIQLWNKKELYEAINNSRVAF